MHLNHIWFESNSSYVANGRHSMMGRAPITVYAIKIETDAIGRIRKYSDGNSNDKSMADMGAIGSFEVSIRERCGTSA